MKILSSPAPDSLKSDALENSAALERRLAEAFRFEPFNRCTRIQLLERQWLRAAHIRNKRLELSCAGPHDAVNVTYLDPFQWESLKDTFPKVFFVVFRESFLCDKH